MNAVQATLLISIAILVVIILARVGSNRSLSSEIKALAILEPLVVVLSLIFQIYTNRLTQQQNQQRINATAIDRSWLNILDYLDQHYPETRHLYAEMFPEEAALLEPESSIQIDELSDPVVRRPGELGSSGSMAGRLRPRLPARRLGFDIKPRARRVSPTTSDHSQVDWPGEPRPPGSMAGLSQPAPVIPAITFREIQVGHRVAQAIEDWLTLQDRPIDVIIVGLDDTEATWYEIFRRWCSSKRLTIIWQAIRHSYDKKTQRFIDHVRAQESR